MQKSQTKLDLYKFVMVDHPRFGEPWVAAGWKYASDGVIVVRVPTSEHRKCTSSSSPLPKMVGWWEVFDEVPLDEWGLLSAAEEFESGDARVCGIKLDGTRYEQLLNLPGETRCRMHPVIDSALAFRFDGGQGIVMGLYEESGDGG